jgi:hypothetical protein
MPNPEQWRERQVDGQYLVDSGLLYMINRDYLHPVGLALTVKSGAICLKDSRLEPEKMIFTKEVVIAGYAKLRKFMEEFGNAQMERRVTELGWSTQPQLYGEKK